MISNVLKNIILYLKNHKYEISELPEGFFIAKQKDKLNITFKEFEFGVLLSVYFYLNDTGKNKHSPCYTL